MGKGGYNGGSTVIHAGTGWLGRGSVTSQPSDKPKPTTMQRNSKPKKKKPAAGSWDGTPKKGTGLTIPEQIARAEKRVSAVRNELATAKQRVAALERDLDRAIKDVEAARNLPRKTALDDGLHQAGHVSAKAASPKQKPSAKSELEADRLARLNYRNAPKEVQVELRSAGALVSKRVVTRS